MNHLLALDQGTTSSRALLFRHDGSVAAVAQREFPQHYPRPGWVEHDPLEIWSSQRDVMTEVMDRAGVGPRDIAALGIANQRETTVLWDRATGDPVHNAIVWQDRRTALLCRRLRDQGLEDTFRDRTGLLLDPYLAGTKLRWILDHVPGARDRAGRGELAFGTIDSWLLWKLTGGTAHCTDASNASRTLLFNIHSGNWDEDLLEILDIPREILPEVRGSSEIIAECALLDGRPIAGVAGDQQAALFGQTCFSKGMTKNTYGTGCFLLMNTGEKPVASSHRLLTTVAWRLGDRTDYALEGSVFIGGAVIQWLRDELGLIRAAEESETLAASVSDSGGVVLVPAFTGLGAPHWDAQARGAMLGITRGTSAGHIARAALESIALQVHDLLDAMNRDSEIEDLTELRVDGGASRNNLLMQTQADILGVPVIRPQQVETTAFGAACLAGLATGFWRHRADISRHWRVDRRFEPAMDDDRRQSLLRNWRRALERARHWVED